MYFSDEEHPVKKSSAFTYVLIVVLGVLLVVGTAVEISYYREMASALDGVERERDRAVQDNKILRNVVLQKLEDNNRLLRELTRNDAEKGKKSGHRS